MEFRKRFPVRFGEADPAGVLYYPRYFHYFHSMVEEFWRNVGGRHYAEVLSRDGVGYPSVRVEADFRRPLRYGEDLEISMRVARLGEKSLTWRMRGFKDGEEGPIIEALVTTACIDWCTFRPVPIPDEHRSIFAPYLCGEEKGGSGI